MGWEELLAEASKVPISDRDKAEPRLSFAYGQHAYRERNITREMVAEEAVKIDDAHGSKGSREQA